MKKRKVKRFDEGGVLTDRYGNPVKSGSGESVRTRYGSEPKSETVDDIQDYASLGRRAGATSSFSGPKEYISESKESEAEEPGETAGKGAKNLTVEKTEVKVSKPVAKKKPAPKKASSYEDTGAKIGSQSFSFDQPKDTSRGMRLAPGSIAEKIASKVSGALDRSQRVGAEAMRESGRQARADRVRRNVGSNLETYGMKKGGKTSSASTRADGIAQRGKTRGKVY